MPYFRSDLSCSLFEQSVIGRCFYKKEKQQSDVNESEGVGLKDLFSILKEFNIWQFTAFYTVLCFRIDTIQGKKGRIVDKT